MPGWNATYAGLRQAVTDWMARDDVDGDADEFIALAEARLNRELSAIETESTLTGVVGASTISILSLTVDRPIALFIAESGVAQKKLTEAAPGTFAIDTTSGRPSLWSRDQRTATDVIQFDRPLSGAYPFRFRYEQRLALSEAAPTNWLMSRHPDVYLLCTLAWAGDFVRDGEYESKQTMKANAALRDVKNHLAQSKRAVLTVDPALQGIGGARGYYLDESL
jgi:hypothetical protein